MPRKVNIWLDCADGRQPVSKSAPLDKDYFDRCLTLTEFENKTYVGRSSSNVQNFKPEPDNALFSSRVVSRSHAVLSANVTTGAVAVKDLGSVHGTWVNGIRITPHEPYYFELGDTLIFGQTIPHASYGLHEARTFRVTYAWSDVDVIDDKKSTKNRTTSTKAPAVPLRPSGTFTVPLVSSEDESEHEEDEDPDFQVTSSRQIPKEKHVPTAKREDSGVVVLSESETESDDEVKVISVTPTKKNIIKIDTEELHDDERDMNWTQSTFWNNQLSRVWDGPRAGTSLPTPPAVETHKEVHRGNEFLSGDEVTDVGYHGSPVPSPVAADVDEKPFIHYSGFGDRMPPMADLEAYNESESDDEPKGDYAQDHSTQSMIDTSNHISGLPESPTYPELPRSAYRLPDTYNEYEIYECIANRPVQSRWDVGPALPATGSMQDSSNDSSFNTSSSNATYADSSSTQDTKRQFSREHKEDDYRQAPPENQADNTKVFYSPVEQEHAVPAAPILAKRTLVNEPLTATVPTNFMSIRNIIEPASETTTPVPEELDATSVDVPAAMTKEVAILQQDSQVVPTITNTTNITGRKRKVDDLDDLIVAHTSHNTANDLATNNDLSAEELTPEAISAVRRKRPSTMKATRVGVKQAARPRPIIERRARRMQMKETKKSWMSTVKPFLLGTLVGGVGVFGALLSLPDMK